MTDARPDGWRVLLIGGHTGAGKSALARALAQRHGVPLIPVDDVRGALQAAVPPERDPDLHWFLVTPNKRELPAEEIASRWRRVAAAVSSALAPAVKWHVIREEPVVLEGDAIAPSFAAQGTFDGLAVGDRVRALFLVEPDPAALFHNARERWGPGTWQPWAGVPDDEVMAFARASCAYGQLLADEARGLGVPVVAPRPYETLVERVEALLGG